MSEISGPSSSRPPSPVYKIAGGEKKEARLSPEQERKIDEVRRSLGEEITSIDVRAQGEEFQALFQGWERISWDEDVGRVARESIGIAEKPKLSEFQKTINQIVETENAFAEAIIPIGVVYKMHPGEVHQVMKKYGFSDQEAKRLFGYTVEAASEIRTMQAGLEGVKALSDEGNEAEALNTLATLLEANYSSYVDAFKDGIIVYNTLIIPRITSNLHVNMSAELNVLLSKYRFETPTHSRLILERFAKPFQRPSRMRLFLEDLVKQRKKEKIIQRARDLVVRKNQELNNYIKGFNNSLDLVLIKALNPAQELGFSKLKKGPFQKRILNAFNKLHNDYEKEIQEIYVRDLEIKAETDPARKRDLRQQFRSYLDSRIPVLNKRGRKFKELGGLETLRSLVRIVEELQSDKTLSSDVRSTLKNLTDNLNDVIKTFQLRTLWIDQVFIDQYFVLPVFEDRVGNVLLKGLVGTDSEWKSMLEKQGLDTKDLRKFHTLYQRHIEAFRPIYLAANRLEEDPENPTLRAAYEKSKGNIPNFNKSIEAFREWGDLPKIRKLDVAIQGYRRTLEKKLNTASPKEKVAINQKLDLLRDMEFESEIIANQHFVGENALL